jgi:hypothetical protein
MSPTPSSSAARPDDKLLEQLVALTAAVKDLAERPPAASPLVDTSEEDRIRQRVAFGYRALGTLMGRVSRGSGREFDARTVRATRYRDFVLLEDVPPAAAWVELHGRGTVELARIHQLDDDDDARATVDATLGGHRPRSSSGVVRPRDFEPDETIGSIVVLRSRRGPVVAFGPRLEPSAYVTHTTPPVTSSAAPDATTAS